MSAPEADRFGLSQPVLVCDRLIARPGCQREILRLFSEHYAALAEERGLRHLGTALYPPFERPLDPAEIVIRWQFDSLEQFWRARMAEENDERLTAFWADIAPLVLDRTRKLGRADLMPEMVPAQGEIAPHPPAGREDRIIAFIEPDPAQDVAARMRWLREVNGAWPVRTRAGINDGPWTGRPGGITLDLAAASSETAGILDLARAHGRIDETVLLGEVLDGGFREPAVSGVKRTILLRTLAGAAPEKIAAMERCLAQGPRHLPEMRNWRLSLVKESSGPIGWTHCFEQEFADPQVLLGAYINHPIHWAVIDRFFHREAHEMVVDAFAHTIYSVDRGVLAEMVAPSA